jgi:hypothetical protein
MAGAQTLCLRENLSAIALVVTAASTCPSMLRPASAWSTLGIAERMRVPSPAARTMASDVAEGPLFVIKPP